MFAAILMMGLGAGILAYRRGGGWIAPPLPGQQGVLAAYSLATAFAAILMMGPRTGVVG